MPWNSRPSRRRARETCLVLDGTIRRGEKFWRLVKSYERSKFWCPKLETKWVLWIESQEPSKFQCPELGTKSLGAKDNVAIHEPSLSFGAMNLGPSR
jgi:hypothetical protein